jgi:hypothetical protein
MRPGWHSACVRQEVAVHDHVGPSFACVPEGHTLSFVPLDYQLVYARNASSVRALQRFGGHKKIRGFPLSKT